MVRSRSRRVAASAPLVFAICIKLTFLRHARAAGSSDDMTVQRWAMPYSIMA